MYRSYKIINRDTQSTQSLLCIAIAKDLDYFCTLVDEVTEEKEGFKRKYELERVRIIYERSQGSLLHFF